MKPLHTHRQGGVHRNGSVRRGTPVKDYPQGYFTALIREHNWPPRWMPSMVADVRPGAADAARNAAQRNRELGRGHGSVPLNLPGAAKYVEYAAQGHYRKGASA